MNIPAVSLLMWSLLRPTRVKATYSIVAVDRETRMVGGAGASCVPNESILTVLYRSVPGQGVLHTQALPLEANSPAVMYALENMGQELPTAILDVMKSLDNTTGASEFFQQEYGFPRTVPDYEFRQNAIVDLVNDPAAYTGASIDDLYIAQGTLGTTQNDDQVSTSKYAFSAQGNVVNENTVASLISGFDGTHEPFGTGCDLPDRLLKAMLTVPDTNAGDERCLQAALDPTELSGTPAAGAFLKVEAADGTTVLELDIVGDGKTDPTIALKEQFEAWRLENPCPGETDNNSSSGAQKTMLSIYSGLVLVACLATMLLL